MKYVEYVGVYPAPRSRTIIGCRCAPPDVGVHEKRDGPPLDSGRSARS